jgi:hypothetical protein
MPHCEEACIILESLVLSGDEREETVISTSGAEENPTHRLSRRRPLNAKSARFRVVPSHGVRTDGNVISLARVARNPQVMIRVAERIVMKVGVGCCG